MPFSLKFIIKKIRRIFCGKRGRKALREKFDSNYILCKNLKDIRGYLRLLSKYLIKYDILYFSKRGKIMRVIAGLCRGRRLKSVKGLTTRPTADRVKEAIFNVLGFRVQDAIFLDLFGGTGSMGIESLSRGGAFTVFVEKERKAVQVLKENLLNCKVNDKAKVYPLDCFTALKLLHDKKMNFNLVYLDPPYKLAIIDDVLEKLVSLQLLKEKAIVITETASETELTRGFDNLKKVREDKYGDIKITYYQLNEEV